jgi:septum formation protein
MPPLILASRSPYRRALLERLRLDFAVCAPDVDEQARPGESAGSLAGRLATAKAEAAATAGAVVVGADQVAALDQRLLGKPGDHATALRQLLACRGRRVVFHTAATVIDARSGRSWQRIDETRVLFASLDPERIDRYLRLERPYDCAGAFKAEGLGIALLERIDSGDPTALIGLPLIWLAATLRMLGLDPLRP